MDAVATGSILAVLGAIAIVVCPGFKIRQLIAEDAERHPKA